MKFNEVKVSLGRTINLGNYESSRVDFSLSAIVEDGDSIDDVISTVRAKCDRELDKLITGESAKGEFDNFIF